MKWHFLSQKMVFESYEVNVTSDMVLNQSQCFNIWQRLNGSQAGIVLQIWVLQ